MQSVDLRTSLRPAQAGLAPDRSDYSIYLAVVCSCKDKIRRKSEPRKKNEIVQEYGQLQYSG